MAPKRPPGTQTSAFGSSGRVNHDASHFYTSRMYEGLQPEPAAGQEDGQDEPCTEQAVPAVLLDTIVCADSRDMSLLPDCSVHLMVTSPPYNARKAYDDDLTLNEYLALLRAVFSETYRVLAPGGRACVNVANLGRKPYIPLSSRVNQLMEQAGFLMRGEIIWDKGPSAGVSTAWGSWRSASNPTIRDVHEYILVFSKDRFRRQRQERADTINRDDFLEWTKSVWRLPAESARRVGHPAPFPVELPRRLIELYTFAGDVVLDPFMGSGSTALAAVGMNRHFVGYEIDQRYVALAHARLAAARAAAESSV